VQPAPIDAQLVPRPERGRTYTGRRRVRLGDVGADGRLRLDALARALADVATDDRLDSGIAGGFWVLRRTAVALGDTPARLGDALELTTWCSGTGARWAERRTDVVAAGGAGSPAGDAARGGEVVARAAALWVHVDPADLRPVALPEGFDALYAPSAGGRTVRARLVHPPPPPDATHRPFPLRVVDLDVLGHVNNAVYWAALEEVLGPPAARRPVVGAEAEIRGGLDHGEAVSLAVHAGATATAVWVTVGGEVRASLLARHR
jgi:acyl-ACP thioesterase